VVTRGRGSFVSLRTGGGSSNEMRCESGNRDLKQVREKKSEARKLLARDEFCSLQKKNPEI